MMLPNNFDVTPFALSNLKPKQRKFVEFLMESGHTNADEVVFKRNYLKNIANAFGAEWAPAWVVKDVSRVTKRGFYAIPELTELINEMSVAVDDVEEMATITDDMDDTITISSDDDMVAVDDATVAYTDVLAPNATVTINKD
tara:strand:+ start:25 stop:450 length:426 start_codon:yes stop_codon:yes gene_type:complete